MSILRFRRASGRALVTLDHRRREPAFDDGQELSVRNAAAHAAHQRSVRNRREVVAEVSVHYLRSPAGCDVPEGFATRHLGVHRTTESILVTQQRRLYAP